jgi:hypothetical protein
MVAWRFRQCPGCRRVMPAGELVTYWEGSYDEPWGCGDMRRVCPWWSYRGRTADFAVVRERHPEERRPA